MKSGPLYAIFVWAFVAFSVWFAWDTRQTIKAQEAQRADFYRKNHCRPLGYVPTRSEPVRTYQCDNGIFVWRDMQ